MTALAAAVARARHLPLARSDGPVDAGQRASASTSTTTATTCADTTPACALLNEDGELVPPAPGARWRPRTCSSSSPPAAAPARASGRWCPAGPKTSRRCAVKAVVARPADDARRRPGRTCAATRTSTRTPSPARPSASATPVGRARSAPTGCSPAVRSTARRTSLDVRRRGPRPRCAGGGRAAVDARACEVSDAR